jgi:hypothetical protein
MKITISEALRIKNELSNTIKTLTYQMHSASFGSTHEDGVLISQDTTKFVDAEANLIKGLNLAIELNDTISKFNKESYVDSIIRKMQNAKLLLSVYSSNLNKTKPTTQKRFENLGTLRQSIEIVYAPYISSKEMKEKYQNKKLLSENYKHKLKK